MCVAGDYDGGIQGAFLGSVLTQANGAVPNVQVFTSSSVITLPDGQTITMRSILIFHRQAGTWKIVQQHNSVGVSDEEVVGKALPLTA